MALFAYLNMKIPSLNTENATPMSVLSVLDFDKESKIWFTLRICNLFINPLSMYLAFSNIKQAYFSIIACLSPIFLNILAPFLLRQKFRANYLVSCLICLLGIIIIKFTIFLLNIEKKIDQKILEN